jgi:predicted MFS family arabinose efflux permease
LNDKIGQRRGVPSGPQALTVALAGTLLLAAAMGVGRFAYTPLLPPLREVLDWSLATAGDVASANFLGYLLGALLAAPFAQRSTRARWLLAGMVGSALTTALGAVGDSVTFWLLIRLLSGVASAFCLVLGTATIVEYLVDRKRPGLVALHFAGVGVDIVLSVAVIESVRWGGGTVHAQWGGLGVITTLLMAWSWWVLRRLPVGVHASVADAGQETAPPTAHGELVRLVIAYGLFGFGYVVTATFIVAMARGLDNAALVEPLTWAVVGLLAAPSVAFWQHLARRSGIFTALRVAFAVEAVGVLLAGYGSGAPALLIGGALLGATFMGITAMGLSAARGIAGRHPGRIIGWMTAAFGLGQLIGPAVAGRLAEVTQGFGLPSLVAAVLLVIALLLLRAPARPVT